MNEDPQPQSDAAPLRAERFSAARMAVHGSELASVHAVSSTGAAEPLLARLEDNAAFLDTSAAMLARAARAGQAAHPAATLLLDRYHLVAEHIRAARRFLLAHDPKAWPRLAVPDAVSRLRIHQLAIELVRHGDGCIEHDSLVRFLAAYTERAPLLLAELEAVSAVLRLALVENLRRLAARLDARPGDDTDAQSVANSLASLEALEAIDWSDFVENLSALERTLCRDPAGIYGRMDRATRAHYRRVAADLCRRTGRDETAVAAAALALAGAPPSPGTDARTRHVGHYLLGDGVPALRARLGLAGEGAARWRTRTWRLGALGALTLLFLAAALVHAYRDGASVAMLLLLGMLAAFPASELALSLLALMGARLAPARPTLRMDFGGGTPADAATLVALSTTLDSGDEVLAASRALEAHYLANREPYLRFCLLADFTDAPLQTMFGDDELLAGARDAIAGLNLRYGEGEGAAPFLLLHRPRTWSETEQAWIGRGRARGRLADLNAFLRGGARERFALIEGPSEGLGAVRHVVAVEAGTQLPHDSVRAMVAALAHPLNQPLLDPSGQRVVAGHALLRPRLASVPPGDRASRYERVGGGAGIDPAGASLPGGARPLAGEGAFGGPVIYDIDTFERVLGQHEAEETVLSQDLPEGWRLRGAWLDDVQLQVPAPRRYSDDAGSHHRRIRGDWQLASGPHAGTLPAPARRQLLGRLRRSLSMPALLALLVLCWAWLPGPAFWSGAALSVFFLPGFIGMLLAAADKPRDMLWRQHLANWSRKARAALRQAAMRTAFLPHEACYSLDALVRGCWRARVSRRKLLEWRSPGFVRASTDLESNWRSMWFAPVLAVACAVLLTFLHPFALFASAPLLLLWFLSPVLAWWLSLPSNRRPHTLRGAQTDFLAKLARRTWHYFDIHAGPHSNWLAPARLQEYPQATLTHSTSPSDIGFGLLATLAAHDFGFITTHALLERVRGAFDSMALLERHRGHFLAGYDTRTLAPLQPRTVSTEQSGSLAAHLLTLAAGLEALADAPVVGSVALGGIRITLMVVEECAHGATRPVQAALERCRAQLAPERCRNSGTLPGLADCLQGLAHASAALARTVPLDAPPRLREWAERLDAQCAAAHADLLAQAPWMRAVQEYVLDASLTRIPTLRELAAHSLAPGTNDAQRLLARMVEEGALEARARVDEISELARRARAFATMDFAFLQQPGTGLLARSWQVDEDRLEDAGHALLAAGARLASFVGVATGQLPARHWSALKRPLCAVGGEQLLLSPQGALADYLAPLLVMPRYRGSLFDQACHAIVRVQVEHGRRHGLPWGMSESACNSVDSALQYQTGVFGVPGTGCARLLTDGRVIAPYAGMLALMVAPQAACANLERLAEMNCMGEYGFYEALDCGAARLPRGQRHAVVRAFVGQHQAMGLLALAWLLRERPLQRHFEADPRLRASLPLLQEAVPETGAFAVPRFELEAAQAASPAVQAPAAYLVQGTGATPQQLQLLSNGRYHVMVTSDGGGYSAWQGQAVTRWCGDASGADTGLACTMRDMDSGAQWSAGWRPTLATPDRYEASLAEGRVELRRRDHDIELATEIVVSPEDDIELRRMRITNASSEVRRIELTSHAALAWSGADAGLAPGRRLLEIRVLAGRGAILATRRPERPEEAQPWLLLVLTVHGGAGGEAACTPGEDAALPEPVLAIRRGITLAPGEEAVADLVLGVAGTEEDALRLVDKIRERGQADRAFDLAWTHGQALLRRLGATELEARLYARLAGAVLYPERALRADPALVQRNSASRDSLWQYGITGALPLVLAHVRDNAGLALARELVKAHAWWRLHGLEADLVLWYGDSGGYRHQLHEQLMGMIAVHSEAGLLDRAGGVHVRAFGTMPNEDRILMQALARVVLFDKRGGLAEQLKRAGTPAPSPALPSPAAREPEHEHAPALPGLLFDNGSGGFSPDGREYLVRSGPGQNAPGPWRNVLANPSFASIVCARGQAHTWSGDADAGRLTPHGHDTVAGSGEAFYLRDEETGAFWSPSAWPAPSGGAYLARHGFGYSVFEHAAQGIASTMSSFVALEAPLKYTVLKLRNDSGAARRLSVTGYVEWVLGGPRAQAAPHVMSARDPASGALLARSAWSGEFAGRSAFFHVDAPQAAFTCDRLDFLGRAGSLARPAALGRSGLSGAVGAAFDPCAALQVGVELQPGEEKELVFVLGACFHGELEALLARHGGSSAATAALEAVRGYWRGALDGLRVETPDPALDLLVNGWLPYQLVACRLWARTGPEAGDGSCRFADVLQDAMALVHTHPALLHAQILACAAHQFLEGDVQGWWQPSSGRGARTRSSSDALWLPLAVCRYLGAGGDPALLDESVPYLEGRALEPGEDACIDLAGQAGESGTVYEHCVRALRRSLQVGPHGLPLMKGGDWNGLLDRVGSEERGESTWLACMLAEVLTNFARLAERRGDFGFAVTCRAAVLALQVRIEEHGWDGAWYRRGFYADGTPLGSEKSAACRVDALTQAWAVLSGAAEPERAAQALAALDAHLVRREEALVRAFDPPFDAHSPDPGRIRGRPPGSIENGGEDTQVALWAAMAFAQAGQGARAWELLDMLNPVRRSATPEGARRYGAEPYVSAAGIDACTPCIGRAGGSWYTGSAAWMYRLIVESLLGLSRVGEQLRLAPVLPPSWPGFRVRYRYGGSTWDIEVRAAGATLLLVDGQPVEGSAVQLVDDGAPHRVVLQLAHHHEHIGAPTEATQSKSPP